MQSNPTPARPAEAEYAPYFGRYISLVSESDVLEALRTQAKALPEGLRRLSEEKAGYRYAPGKWSVREVLGHLIDGERVFGYRSLRIARGDVLSLPSFDENQFAGAAGHDRCPLPELLEEFAALRTSHLLMYRHFDEVAWKRIGRVNEQPTSTRALAFIMAGHVRHHCSILSTRYGVEMVA